MERPDGGTSGGPDTSGTLGGGDGSPSGGSSSDCSEAAKLVYVVSAENDLYSFRPAALEFAKIGTLQCPAKLGATPFSMAVDRSGIAWVDYTDGSLFKVSTTDATCARTSFTPQHGFATFGMGFSSNAPGSTEETLFVRGVAQGIDGYGTPLGLATIDVRSLVLTPVGEFTGELSSQPAELTGTGDARLFGFFVGNRASLAEISKSNAATPSPRAIDGIQAGMSTAFAFSFWGGDFWFYTDSKSATNNTTSDVTRLKMSDGSVSVVKRNVGFTIVGAGVSTCAPTAAPR